MFNCQYYAMRHLVQTLFQLILNCMCFYLFSECRRNENGNFLSCKSVWTGGWYKAVEDNFVWTNNNERVVFKKWAPNRPDNVNKYKDCIRFLVDGSWTNHFCLNKASFICEKTLVFNK